MSWNIKAEIVRITAHRACEARTDNQLLVVFACPAAPELRLGDILIFQDLATDGEIVVSRTPSRERLRGA
jgi:hypothetical protein